MLGDLFPDNVTTSVNTICINRVELLFRPFNIHTDGMINVDLAVNTLKTVKGHIALKVITTCKTPFCHACLGVKTAKTVFVTV